MEQLEREPTNAELAEALGIEQSELLAYQSQAQAHQLVSLDEMTDKQQGDNHLSLTERLLDTHVVPPDAAMLSAEDRRVIRQCVSELPKTQGTVLVLHYLQGIPLRDVATVLAVTPSRVSQLHHQALGRLKQVWERVQSIP